MASRDHASRAERSRRGVIIGFRHHVGAQDDHADRSDTHKTSGNNDNDHASARAYVQEQPSNMMKSITSTAAMLDTEAVLPSTSATSPESYLTNVFAPILRPHSTFSDRVSPVPAWTKAPDAVDKIQLADVLSHLSKFDLISNLVCRWSQISQMSLVPSTFLEEALVSLQTSGVCFDKAVTETDTLAAKILSATVKPFVVPPNTQALEFSKLFTYCNLRLETVGLVLTIAGLAALKLPPSDALFVTHSSTNEERQAFVADMMAASDTCVTLCEKYSNPSDLTTWLRIENLTLATNRWGSASYGTWQRSGRLFNDVLLLSLHREPEDPARRPLFLEELRARFFASAYRTDKALSAMSGRPPRLSLHYCNRRLPLHLRDEHLIAPEHALQEAVNSLDGDGWSVEADFQPTAWLRARYILATFREEILYVELGPPDPKTAASSLLSAALLSFGLPSALVLAVALKSAAELGQKMTYPLPWPELYRQLSGLASDLEAIVRSSDGDNPFFRRGIKFLLDTLDDALNARMSIPPQLETFPASMPMPPTSADSPSSNAGGNDILTWDERSLRAVLDSIGATDFPSLGFNSFGDGITWS
ncbi:hypothetical protein DL769_002901 [Monosporascus sp. CRB-8-3]|nr:hypothetical protein DL769_002901 [Monosporascus sp. CRB-8-3]